jgi:hypothetical protein
MFVTFSYAQHGEVLCSWKYRLRICRTSDIWASLNNKTCLKECLVSVSLLVCQFVYLYVNLFAPECLDILYPYSPVIISLFLANRWLQPPAHAGSSLAGFSTLKMEAIRSSETLVHTRSTRRHIPEDGILKLFIIYVPNQQLQSQLHTQNSIRRYWKSH